MNIILDLIDRLDSIWMLVLIGILTTVGSCMVGSDRDLRRWGNRLGAGGFVAYAIYGIQVFAPRTADEFVAIAIRSLFFSGLVLGCSWICLGILGFAHKTAAELHHQRREAMRRQECERRERESAESRASSIKEANRQKQVSEPVVARSQRVQQDMHESCEMYRQELEAIKAAQLKGSERRTVREDAKRRYLKRIRKILDG